MPSEVLTRDGGEHEQRESNVPPKIGDYHDRSDFSSVFRREINDWVGRNAETRKGRKHGVRADRLHPDNDLVGLALSGGGIRSATFCLGAVQAMARYNVLERVDYLSTVSGGGYFGSAVTTLLYHQGTPSGVSAGDFPFRFDASASASKYKAERAPVRHLREYSNYLLPHRGPFDAETWRGAADMALRLVLHLSLVVAPFALFLALASLVFHRFWDRAHPWSTPWMLLVPGIASGVALIASAVLAGFCPSTHRNRWADGAQLAFLWLFWAGAFLLAFVAAAMGLERGVPHVRAALVSAFGGGAAGLLALGRSVAGKLPALQQSSQSGQASATSRVTSMTTQFLFRAFGFLVLALGIVLAFYGLDHVSNAWEVLGAAFAFAVTMAITFGGRTARGWLNSLAIHSFYRNKLSRAYLMKETASDLSFGDDADVALQDLMGQRKAARPGLFRRFVEAIKDRELAEEMRDARPPVGPLHIFSAALTMAGDSDLKDLGRKSDGFFFSCLYSGSSATGFALTSAVYPNLNVSHAMAISGAAVSPNMGSSTTGSNAVLLTLINLRLGQWEPNPLRCAPASANRNVHRQLAIWYYFKELFGAASSHDGMVYLSDGGHFDNSGIYELVRRRCRFIIAVDGSGEPSVARPGYGAIGEVSRLVRIDFGVDLDIDLRLLYPLEKTGRSLAQFAVGRINYPKASPNDPDCNGVLVYIKACLTGAENRPDLEYYHRKDGRFPLHSTADQFFDEQQFEEYRELGYLIAKEAFTRETAPGTRAPRFDPAANDLDAFEQMHDDYHDLLDKRLPCTDGYCDPKKS